MTKNRGAMSKLAATNRMLIDSLDALDATGSKLQPLRGAGGTNTNPGTPIAVANISNSNASAQNSSRTGRKLSPIRRAVSPISASTNNTNLELFGDNGIIFFLFQFSLFVELRYPSMEQSDRFPRPRAIPVRTRQPQTTFNRDHHSIKETSCESLC